MLKLPQQLEGIMKISARKALYAAVITLVSIAPMARAQEKSEFVSPQGLVVAMPEASSPVMLATDLLCAGVLIWLFRRRAPSTNQ